MDGGWKDRKKKQTKKPHNSEDLESQVPRGTKVPKKNQQRREAEGRKDEFCFRHADLNLMDQKSHRWHVRLDFTFPENL